MKHSKYSWLAIPMILALFLLLSGCYVNRKGELTEKGKNFIALHCQGKDSVVTNHEIIFKDTTVYISEKGETIYIQNPCDSIKPIVTKKNGIKSSVHQVGKGLVFECEADSLRAVIKLLEYKSSTVKKERVVIQKPCEKEHISKLDSFWIILGRWFLGFILFQVLVKFLSSYPALVWIKFLYVFRF